MDLLTDVLTSLRVIDSSLGLFEFDAPWGYAIRPAPTSMVFLFSPVAGHCRVQLSDGQAAELAVGDVALILGTSFEFVSSPDALVRPFLETWLDEQMPGMGPQVARTAPLRFSGRGRSARRRTRPAQDRLLTVALMVEDVVQSPVLAVLPPLIVLRRDTLQAGAWLDPLARFIDTEMQSPQPGYNATARQLAHWLFIALLRLHILHTGTEQASWMRGMADGPIGQVLTLMHSQYSQPWDLPRLAQACGMSKSKLSARFRELVGTSPMSYLTTVRLHHAAQRLVAGQAVAATAEQVGYRSEWSFRQAFVKQFGVTPLRYGKAPPPLTERPQAAAGATTTGAPDHARPRRH